MSELTDLVLSVIAATKHISPDKISTENSLEELGIDSLDKITLIFELEKKCQITIPDEALESIHKVRDIIEGVAKLVSQTSIGPAGAGVSQ